MLTSKNTAEVNMVWLADNLRPGDKVWWKTATGEVERATCVGPCMGLAVFRLEVDGHTYGGVPVEVIIGLERPECVFIAKGNIQTIVGLMAEQIVREIYAQGGEAEENLRAKCRWEQMTPVAVVIEWGDPRTW